MNPHQRGLRIGSETQTYETKPITTGIQRVMRETHGGLTDFLASAGHTVSWVNTLQTPRATTFRSHPYIASDPVLQGPGFTLEDLDILLMLDISINMDYSLVLRAKRERGLRVVALVHDILPISHPQWFPKDGQAHFRRYLQKVFHVADDVVVTTSHVADSISGLGWRKLPRLHTIPLGSAFTSIHFLPQARGEVSLLYVSTVEPRKGHRQLLEAFERLRSACHDVSLTLVGAKGWADEGLYQQIEQHPDFGGRLRWVRKISDNEMASLAARSSLAVIPAEAEGFGLFMEEALSWGLPVVASDIPPFRERTREGVWLSSLEPEQLASTILKASSSMAPGDVVAPVRSMRDFARDLSALLVSEEIENEII